MLARTHALAVPMVAAVTLGAGLVSAGPAHADGFGASAPGEASGAPALRLTDLAVRGQGGYPQYRIPALTSTTKGTLLAAYDGRPTIADLPSHITILVRRSTDQGRTWTQQQIVRQAPAPAGFGDPSLLVDHETGRIFVFYAAGVNQGFGGSGTGNSETDPNILQTDYSYSDDDGLTWTSRRITSQIKNPAWSGLFAASGQGIQLRHGPYAGRLLQQYLVRISGQNYAATAYSDDHGATWKMGRPVGPGMDENKTVELSDGSVMLNSRATPRRLVAISHDGGVTYSTPQADPALVDPADNGSIIRVSPDAPRSDPRSRQLLFVNNDDPTLRRNLTVRMSCDSGRTWPVSRVVDPDSAGYSTLTRQSNGRFGLLYERDGYQKITYTSFGLDWLKGVCAPISVKAPDSVRAGTAGTVTATVTDQQASALAKGTLRVSGPTGWDVTQVSVPRIQPGRPARVNVGFRVPRTAFGDQDLTFAYTSAGRRSSTITTLHVQAAPSAPARPKLDGTVVLDHLDAGGAPGLPGDVVSYAIRVRNSGNTTANDVTLTGGLDGLGVCHYSALTPGQSYKCTATHTLTAADVANGFAPQVRVTGTTPDGSSTSTRVGVEPWSDPATS
ncbi:exo-alpha-sialidase [Allobranchiibius sp. CTAmp26]|uniref:exo-alpha-sialidase n=1 Tax=Allobranchiibius sp. CTAmp26 TaxID=2815214 RepID=UPI001AA111AE|nr:exo-alpha-sialidase [Allobranchiibius sp. CTAmp26]MBO1754564.1 exo-alpha-sialidase [Allobranchiibius sp. CTAmp26]